MNESLEHLVDPQSGGPLKATGGFLVGGTGQRYPIVDHIPRFVGEENYASDFGWQWKQFAKTQLDSVVGLPISRERLERCLGEPLTTLSGKRVLEVGSGAGRFTEILLAEGALLDSLDYSVAVEANASNNGDKQFTLVQADVRAMPFPKQSYDVVVCLGVIQHTPNSEETIRHLYEMVRPGGKLVIDHYAWQRGNLPWPIGGAARIWRRIILSLPREKRFSTVQRLVDLSFPLYWRFRDTKWSQRILCRLAAISFYDPRFRFKDKRTFYEWALLDTHDATTDVYKHRRTQRSIRKTLEGLGAVEVTVNKGGNGIEAYCYRPAGQ